MGDAVLLLDLRLSLDYLEHQLPLGKVKGLQDLHFQRGNHLSPEFLGV